VKAAAGKCHLEIVKWLHLNRTEGCTLKAIYVATLEGRHEVAQWLRSNRTECLPTNATDDEEIFPDHTLVLK
jgi:hypothetical protein